MITRRLAFAGPLVALLLACLFFARHDVSIGPDERHFEVDATSIPGEAEGWAKLLFQRLRGAGDVAERKREAQGPCGFAGCG